LSRSGAHFAKTMKGEERGILKSKQTEWGKKEFSSVAKD
jgi:hypothetical protein